MFTESFPILYLNLAGEMIYIIDQRLTAQNVDNGKAQKVLNEITMAVFNPKLIQEVFKPHSTITFAILRSIFEKLAHSSIMRLNEQSMNKLFDLMIMVVKYQMFCCPKPSDLITITDNHLLSIVELIQYGAINGKDRTGDDTSSGKNMIKLKPNEENSVELVSNVRNQFLFYYHSVDLIQLQMIRYSILNFLKDIRTRVSIFLREGIQTNDGKFVIATDRIEVECECQIPGVVRYFRGSDNQLARTEHFTISGEYLVRDSRTILGLDIYKKESSSNKMELKGNQIEENCEEKDGENTRSSNQQEIDLLAMLLCKNNDESEQEEVEFRFDFLENQNETKTDERSEEQNANVIDLTTSESNQQLIELIKDLHITEHENRPDDQVDENEEEIDFLELMDS